MIDLIIFKGLCYTLTIISTYRATTRIKHILQNNGTIDLLDGPYIEKPNFNTTTSALQDDNNVRLWEAVYTFQQAVQLNENDNFIYDEEDGISDNNDDDDGDNIPYSLSPYSTYSSFTSRDKDINDTITTSTTIITKGEGNKDITTSTPSLSSKILSSSRTKYFYNKPSLSFISYQSIQHTSKSIVLYPMNKLKNSMKLLKKHNFKYYPNQQQQQIPMKMKKCTKKIIIPHVNKTAKITSYALPLFRELRSKFLLDQHSNKINDSEEYFISKMNSSFKSFSSNSKGAARAGLIFFFSNDGAYLIKQIKKSEAKLLLSILPKYYKYMKLNHKKSLLTRFFGLYHIHLEEDDKEYYFVIMNSIYPVITHDKKYDFINERYDLKGSTVGRECSVEERTKKGSKAILKDLDLINESQTTKEQQQQQANSLKSGQRYKRRKQHQPNSGFQFGAVAKSSLLFQLRKDVRFLLDCNVIDYSLLVGIVPLGNDHNNRKSWFQRFFKQSDNNNNDILHSSSSLSLSVKEEIDNSMLADDEKTSIVLSQKLFSSTLYLFQIISSPSIYILSQIVSLIQKPISSLLPSTTKSTNKIPYYNAEKPSINGGKYSMIYGKRNNARAIYYLGIIDFLQPWTMSKKIEHELKGLVLGQEKKGKISCIPPKEYADRFLNFMEGNIT